MTSPARAELRRSWRADCSNFKLKVPWRTWTPTLFDTAKAQVKKRAEEHFARLADAIKKQQNQ